MIVNKYVAAIVRVYEWIAVIQCTALYCIQQKISIW